MELKNKDCPLCMANNQFHTYEGSYILPCLSMTYIEEFGWQCNHCGYTESDNGK